METGDIAIIVASVAVIITFVGIILADKRTKESNELTVMELKQRLRPWLKINQLWPTSAILYSGGTQEWKTFADGKTQDPSNLKSVGYNSEIENIGSLPVKKMKVKVLQKNEKLTKQDVKNDGNEYPVFPLMPQEHLSVLFEMKGSDYLNRDKKPQYLGIYVEYEVEEKTNSIGKIWEIGDPSIANEDYWLD